MKRKPLWKELNLPPPSKRPAASVGSTDPHRHEAAQTLRSNCVRTLVSALCTPSAASEAGDGEGPRAPDISSLQDLAEAVEKELFLHHHSDAGQDYKAAARTLVAGLKRNTNLRGRVLRGDLPPAALVSLDPRELATEAQQREYARMQEAEARRVTLAGRGAATVTSDYRCSRCGGSSCDYLDSGRRDIGKCETWGSKDGQGVSRLVTCLGCGHRWEVDDV